MTSTRFLSVKHCDPLVNSYKSFKMVKLGKLLGAHSVVHFECMYTKHKTQKRKVWHDGFVTLYDSRKIVLCEEPPPSADSIEEANLSCYEWDRKDEEYITLPRHLIEIINTTPLDVSQATSHGNELQTDSCDSETSQSQQCVAAAAPSARRSFTNTKFKTPLARGGTAAGPNVAAKTSSSYSVASSSLSSSRSFVSAFNKKSSSVNASIHTKVFDFDRNPTNPWINLPIPPPRSLDQVSALFHGRKRRRNV